MNKIFAVGLPKTGTSSLNEALNIIAYRALHNPLDLRFLSYRQGIYQYPRDDWDAITNFGEHFYPQLDLNYPNSKFILTIRDKQQWLESSAKWFGTPPQYPWKDYQPKDLLILSLNEDDFWSKICHFLNKQIPQVDYPNQNLGANKKISRSGIFIIHNSIETMLLVLN